MKAIILAGGSGTRLYPVTKVINKHLLPIYNKPMIYYPLSVIMLLGIRDIFLVVNPHDLENFKGLLGDGKHIGINIIYLVQEEPRGLAEGLVLAENYIKSSKICYVLGDNIFFGNDLVKTFKEVREKIEREGGAYIFGYSVKDPERFGVVEFDCEGNVISIEEKPKKPKSNFAVVGFYFFDENAPLIAKKIKPSHRGELEITSVIEEYLKMKRLKVELLGRGLAWFDAGTNDSFLEAGEFVATIEKKTGLMVGCIEEIAFRNGWITKEDLLELAKSLKNTDYGKYLEHLAKGKD